MTPETQTPQMKTCCTCGLSLPIDRFRFRRRGRPVRQGRCRQCHNAYMRAYRRARKNRLLHRFADELRQSSVSRVFALCNAMMDRFGGVEGFSAAWYDAIQAAGRERPGGRTVLSSLHAVLRLLEAYSMNRPRHGIGEAKSEGSEP